MMCGCACVRVCVCVCACLHVADVQLGVMESSMQISTSSAMPGTNNFLIAACVRVLLYMLGVGAEYLVVCFFCAEDQVENLMRQVCLACITTVMVSILICPHRSRKKMD